MKLIHIKTPQNKFDIEVYYDFIEKSKIKTNKKLFSEMCKTGCKNYNKKYSCPPFSPDFSELIRNKDKEGLFVVLFKCNLNQINSTEYNKMRIANVVMKSKIDKMMRALEKEFNTTFLSTGSCRLCKPCKIILKHPCKHPNERRYSLESTGIDCNALAEDLFGMKLAWYKSKKELEYTCVLCGLLINKKDSQEAINKLNALIEQ